jgi:hypothetical protein
VTGLDDQLGKLEKGTSRSSRAKKEPGDEQERLDARLDEIARDLAALRAAVAPGEEPPPRAQERLTVTES